MSPTRRARVKRRLLGAPFWPITLYLGLISLIALVSGGLAPEPLLDALPGWLVIMWTLSLMCGGFLSFGGLMSGQNRVETAGCIFLIYGATLYGVVLAFEEWPHWGGPMWRGGPDSGPDST